MFRYCEKGWKWLFLTMIALSVVACGDDTDDFWGSAVWRTSSTVGAAEGSAAIQIEGPVGAGWRAEIKDGGAWCSFRLNDPTVLVKEGTVQSSNISNIQGGGTQSLYREREKLVRTYENMKNELQTYENNLGFLTSTSKKGSSLLTELNRKVDKLKADLELVLQKIKVIDESIKAEE